MGEAPLDVPKVREFSAVIDELAGVRPSRPALTIDDVTITFAELRVKGLQAASCLKRRGVGAGDVVGVAMRTSIDEVAFLLGLWRLGATPLPLPPATPEPELAAIVSVAGATLVVDEGMSFVDEPLWEEPPILSAHRQALATGGSTGVPKVILDRRRAEVNFAADMFGWNLGDTMLVGGPLFHSGPINHLFEGLSRGKHILMMARFDPRTALRLIDTFRPHFAFLVPTMMHRMIRLPDEERAAADVTSLRRVWHTAAHCPEWLKRQWIGWVGAEHIWEIFGGSEGLAMTVISGTEWLEHPGSVGRLYSGEIAIFGPDGDVVPPGVTGEIYMRPDACAPQYSGYVGNPAGRRIIDGWESFGDLGYLDEDGYLFLADRRVDVIITGGENVYPAEVESALQTHPAIVDCAVFGVNDEDLGQVVCAVASVDRDVDVEDLDAHLRGRIARYKMPRRIIISSDSVRNEAGKVRRSALRRLFERAH